MNPILEEILIEEHRKDILREMNNIRLEEEALKAKAYQPNWFTRTMQSFGEWLIARGEDLVKRYEIPANCATPSRRGYAH